MVELHEYAVPQDPRRVKLNQNESPFDIPAALKEEVFARLRQVGWNRYPSGQAHALAERIAGYTGFPVAGVLAGNGSNEMIQTLIYSTCDSGDRILVVEPGFSVYRRVASVMNIDVVTVPLKEDFGFDTDAIIDQGKGAKLIILATPNNPTGTVLRVDDIADIANQINGLVAIDEAYYEFCRETAQGFIERFENLIVIRTFSKSLRLAGIRLGYVLGREDVVRELAKARLPFSLSIFQQTAGEVLLENPEFLEAGVREILRERDRVFEGLAKIRDISPVPSLANFLLFQCRCITGRDLYQKLYQAGVVLRRFDHPRLESSLRVTIGTAQENDIFLEKLREAMEE
ncbi:MAG: histidinol-phosphate transaminase [candidate division Zixibacteria bacterium RBG_16_53_22]|nr:MAG: histidinol-phosphate transaminase [candidate division Zixibacteria bacterium RBG_16_53_22]